MPQLPFQTDRVDQPGRLDSSPTPQAAAMPRAPPPRPSEDARLAAYKPGVDVARSRRRREDRLLAVRRSNRDAGLFKRRRDEPTPTPIPPARAATPSSQADDVPTTTTATSPPSSAPSSPPSSPPAESVPPTAADSEVRAYSRVLTLLSEYLTVLASGTYTRASQISHSM